MKKAAAVLFVILLIPVMVSGAAVLKNENPSKTENLGYGVTYEYWDTSTGGAEAGALKPERYGTSAPARNVAGRGFDI